MSSDFVKIPVNKFFEFKLISHSEDHAEITMPVKESYLQETGVVHGGIISALADTTAVYVFFPKLAGNQTMACIEFKVNFLRPALLQNGELKAKAKLVKRGRKVGICDVEVFQREQLIAKGLFTYLFSHK